MSERSTSEALKLEASTLDPLAGKSTPVGIKAFARRRMNKWLKKRIPQAKQVRLSHKSVFIFPSKYGFQFFLLMIVLFVLAMNFQSSLTFALVFLLGSLLFVTVHHTYKNLAGLTLTAVPTTPCFVGDSLKLNVRLSDPQKRPHQQIRLGWHHPVTVDIKSQQELQVELIYQATKRGYFQPERLRVATLYPLGLLEAWSWVDLTYGALVYPKPLVTPFRYLSAQSDQVHEGQYRQKGIDDFYGFKAYQAGDSLKHVAWKQVAKGQGLMTKEFEDSLEHSHWLDWQAASGDSEQRLSILCGWVLSSHELGYEYGLKMPGTQIEPARGDAHRDQCLQVLALFGAGSSLDAGFSLDKSFPADPEGIQT